MNDIEWFNSIVQNEKNDMLKKRYDRKKIVQVIWDDVRELNQSKHIS